MLFARCVYKCQHVLWPLNVCRLLGIGRLVQPQKRSLPQEDWLSVLVSGRDGSSSASEVVELDLESAESEENAP